MDNITSLQVSDTKPGTGTAAASGKHVTVHYTGWLYDPKAADRHGQKFDSSRDRGEPFTFKLGARQVISGWDMGVAGMKVRSEEHTSELQSHVNLVCRLLLEKKKKTRTL